MSTETDAFAPTSRTILVLVRAFSEATGVEESAVGFRIFNDGKKLAALKDGRDISVRRALLAWHWLSDHWPEGHKWPRGIERPTSARRAA